MYLFGGWTYDRLTAQDMGGVLFFFFSSRRRHTRCSRDWSSDVCSSDLVNLAHDLKLLAVRGRVIVIGNRGEVTINVRELMGRRGSIRAFTLWGITPAEEIGRASCRGRGENSGVAGSLKKKKKKHRVDIR